MEATSLHWPRHDVPLVQPDSLDDASDDEDIRASPCHGVDQGAHRPPAAVALQAIPALAVPSQAVFEEGGPPDAFSVQLGPRDECLLTRDGVGSALGRVAVLYAKAGANLGVE